MASSLWIGGFISGTTHLNLDREPLLILIADPPRPQFVFAASLAGAAIDVASLATGRRSVQPVRVEPRPLVVTGVFVGQEGPLVGPAVQPPDAVRLDAIRMRTIPRRITPMAVFLGRLDEVVIVVG